MGAAMLPAPPDPMIMPEPAAVAPTKLRLNDDGSIGVDLREGFVSETLRPRARRSELFPHSSSSRRSSYHEKGYSSSGPDTLDVAVAVGLGAALY